MKARSKDAEPPKGGLILSLPITPALAPILFEAATRDADVLILTTFASGAFPDRLVPVVEQRISEGKAVIVLTDNIADNTGMRGVRYAAGSGAYAKGMRGLQKVNFKDLELVYAAVKKAYDSGLRGQALADYIEEEFSFKDGEEFPAAELDTKEEVDAMRAMTRIAYKKHGLTGHELEEQMRCWEFGNPDTPGWL